MTPPELQPPPFPPGIHLHGAPWDAAELERMCKAGKPFLISTSKPTENPMGCWSIWVGAQSQENLLDKAKLQELHLAVLFGFIEGIQ